MKPIILLLCLRYLQHRRIVLLSMAAVAISCALLIVTDSLFTGFIDTIERSTVQHFGDIIIEAPSNRRITDYTILIEQLESSEDIVAATPVLSSQGLLLSRPGKVNTVMVWGIRLPQRFEVDPLEDAFVFQQDKPIDEIDFGVPNEPGISGGIVSIGVLSKPDNLTDEYDLDAAGQMLGTTMSLTTGSVDSENDISRSVIKFELADVLMTGWHRIDESFVLLPIEVLSESLYPDEPQGANLIHIRLEPGMDVEEARTTVNRIWTDFSQDRFTWSSLANVEVSREMYARLLAEYKKQMKVLLLIFGLVSGGIILLVFCIFYLIVMTRRKDIGILKSCGLSIFSVAGIFVSFGTVIGAIGAALGVLLGWLIISHINPIQNGLAAVLGFRVWKSSTYMFSMIPNTMDWDSIWWILAAGIIAAAVGSLIPAVAAARIKPVRTLQFE